MNETKDNFLEKIAVTMPAFLDVDTETFGKFEELSKFWKAYEDNVETFIETKINIGKVLEWVDEDLQKVVIPILEEVNAILKDNLANESDALYQFNSRVEQYYNEIDLKNLNQNLQEYLKNWISKVEDRVFKILVSNNN